MRARLLSITLVCLSSAIACKPTDDSPPDAGPVDIPDAAVSLDAAVTPDAAITDAGTPDARLTPGTYDGGDYDGGYKAEACASSFGNVLTSSFGRVDGTVVAVVRPQDTQCALPNNDHLVVQVSMNGAVYRMVVNVLSASSDPNVRMALANAALPAPAFAEGWHPAQELDYARDLGRHQADFTPFVMGVLVQRVTDMITVGAPISVYATSSGGTNAASTHLIHRNGNLNDGAVVLDPTGPNPTWLLFSFSNQQF
jgi:hypothetical protein